MKQRKLFALSSFLILWVFSSWCSFGGESLWEVFDWRVTYNHSFIAVIEGFIVAIVFGVVGLLGMLFLYNACLACLAIVGINRKLNVTIWDGIAFGCLLALVPTIITLRSLFNNPIR